LSEAFAKPLKETAPHVRRNQARNHGKLQHGVNLSRQHTQKKTKTSSGCHETKKKDKRYILRGREKKGL